MQCDCSSPTHMSLYTSVPHDVRIHFHNAGYVLYAAYNRMQTLRYAETSKATQAPGH